MNKDIIPELIIALLVLLFAYAGTSKLLDMHGFIAGMKQQPFPAWLNKVLAVVLPGAEVAIAVLLVFKRTRPAALYAYVLLMLCFTGYTALVVFDFFSHRPCGCGGIISGLSWNWHFVLNIIFLILACIAIRLHTQSKLLRDQGASQKPVTE